MVVENLIGDKMKATTSDEIVKAMIKLPPGMKPWGNYLITNQLDENRAEEVLIKIEQHDQSVILARLPIETNITLLEDIVGGRSAEDFTSSLINDPSVALEVGILEDAIRMQLATLPIEDAVRRLSSYPPNMTRVIQNIINYSDLPNKAQLLDAYNRATAAA